MSGGRMSRAKGKRGEIAVCALIRETLPWVQCHTTRSLQAQRHQRGTGDVVILDEDTGREWPVYLEVKWHSRVLVTSAMHQALEGEDCRGRIIAVVHHDCRPGGRDPVLATVGVDDARRLGLEPPEHPEPRTRAQDAIRLPWPLISVGWTVGPCGVLATMPAADFLRLLAGAVVVAPKIEVKPPTREPLGVHVLVRRGGLLVPGRQEELDLERPRLRAVGEEE